MLTDLAKEDQYRREILHAGGLETMTEGMTGCCRQVLDASKELKKLLFPSRVRWKLDWHPPHRKTHTSITPMERWSGDGKIGRKLDF